MSTVKLVSFAGFKTIKVPGSKERKVDILFGAQASREGADGNIELLAGSVPLRRGLVPPPLSSGILLLYGFRDALEEIEERLSEARKEGAEFQYADIEVEVGQIETGVITKELIVHNRFANVKRMTAELQQIIRDAFATYVEEEGGDVDKEMSRIRMIASRPDLFGRLLDEHPLFKHLDVIVIPVEDRARIRQVAYIRPSAIYVDVRQNTDDAILLLPLTAGQYKPDQRK